MSNPVSEFMPEMHPTGVVGASFHAVGSATFEILIVLQAAREVLRLYAECDANDVSSMHVALTNLKNAINQLDARHGGGNECLLQRERP